MFHSELLLWTINQYLKKTFHFLNKLKRKGQTDLVVYKIVHFNTFY